MNANPPSQDWPSPVRAQTISTAPAPATPSETKNARRLSAIRMLRPLATSTPSATIISEMANVAGTAVVPSAFQSSGAKSARMLRAIVISR